jgi:ketosteroid isomerase-like protein
MGMMSSYDFVILDMVAEGSKVVVEGISRGSGPTEGAKYENQVAMVITINEYGKINSVREFLDPFEVFAYGEANTKG